MLLVMIYLFLGTIGLALGSFVNAFVWRLHIRGQGSEVRGQKKNRSNIQHPTSEYSIVHGRSMCPNCKHRLAGKDLIPVLSWLSLKGRCRYCKKPISAQYPAVEILMSALVVISYCFWPYALDGVGYLLFSIWVVMLVLLLALAVYDIRYMILPTELVYALDGLVVTFVAIVAINESSKTIFIDSIIGSVLLGGLFWLLYQISKGAWIGGGDVRFGFGMGFFLGWQKALVGLSAAAYIGTFIVIIALILGKYHKKMKLPFGPLLIGGWFVAFIWGDKMIDWYIRLIGA